MVIVYKAPVSLTSVFKHCYFSGLRESRLRQTEFQYTWLNSYFFSSLRESRPDILSYQELRGSCDIVRSLLQQLSLSLRYLVSLYTALWYRTIVSSSYRFPPSPREAVTPLVTRIPYNVSYTFPIVIVSYWVVLSFVHLVTPLAPCTQLGYSTLPTMYYQISTSVAIPCLFDSITCFVSCILSPLYLCFRTQLFRYLCSFAF